MRKLSVSALAAVGLMAGVANANAADLGGNCCADLEERIAELEATTARKGNRKVSLTISGWVAEQLVWWDDGHERNMYVAGLGRTLQSHVKFSGEAKIHSGLTAGYVLHIEFGTVDAFTMTQKSDESATFPAGVVADTGQGVYVLQSYWFLKSDHLGKVSLGKQSQASDNTAILVDGSGSLVPANWLVIEGAGFFMRSKGALTPFKWGDVGFCHSIGDGIAGDCNGVTQNVIRYDSPTFAGFSMSASYGENDMWDVAGRYAGEFSGIKIAAAIAYSQVTDENLAVLASAYTASKRDVGYLQVGAYLQHTASGLFVYGAYGRENVKMTYIDPLGDGAGGEVQRKNPDHWYIKAGLRQRFTSLGHTVMYGEYGERNDMMSPALADSLNIVDGVGGSNAKHWGLGLVQEIDAAAMSIWLTYRNLDANVTDSAGVKTEFDNMHIVKFGALISF